MGDNGIKKLYYSISEVAKMFGVETHVLRYWESEFKELKPKKNRAGRRTYRSSDIELISKIKHLLKVEKYTIEGAKKVLRDGTEVKVEDSSFKEELVELRKFLEELLEKI